MKQVYSIFLAIRRKQVHLFILELQDGSKLTKTETSSLEKKSVNLSPPKHRNPVTTTTHRGSPVSISKLSDIIASPSNSDKKKPTSSNHYTNEHNDQRLTSNQSTSDILERAQAAIAIANRACASARTAALLANTRVDNHQSSKDVKGA